MFPFEPTTEDCQGPDDLPLDQIAPKIISLMKTDASQNEGESFEDRVNLLLDAWMESWGSIPHSDHFLTDALGECLIEAVSLGMRDKVERLLRFGADPDYEEGYYQLRNEDGSETLIPAYRFPVDDFQGAVEECDFTRRCLHVAVENNDADTLELMLTYGADKNAREKPQQQTPLHDAARAEERFECLKLLVHVGADVDAMDFNGHTALYRTLKVVGDSVQLNLKGARFLVAKDVNLQGRGHLMKVSRIMAMRSVSHETFETLCEFVKLLLDHGVRLDDRTVNDDPLLWYCFAHFEKDALGMVSLLLNRGACNPHRHTGQDLAVHRLNHVVPCSVIRLRSITDDQRRLASVDCFSEGATVLQDAAIVNFTLQKLATLINADRSDLERIDAVLDGAAASLEFLISSIDTTKSGCVKWCRNDAWNQAWTHVDKLTVIGHSDAAIVSRFEALTSWALRVAETQPTSLKNLARHHVRKLILSKRREEVRREREEEEEEEEEEGRRATKENVAEGGVELNQDAAPEAGGGDGTAEEGDTTAGENLSATSDSDQRTERVDRDDWLQWSPRMYAFLEEDIASLGSLPQYLRRYLLFQCR